MIHYTVQEKKSPRTGTSKYYVQIAPTVPVTRSAIISQIEKITSLSSSDVKACLDALEYCITEAMKEGKSVRLGDLGSFRPTLSSFGTTERNKANSTLIRFVRVRFTMSGQMGLDLQPERLEFALHKNVKVVPEE